MSRYDEIINESDLEECSPVTTQFESTPTTRSWRLYRLDLMDVYPIDENQICHRKYAAKREAAKDEESVIRFRNSGKFRGIKWKILKQDRLDEKP